MKKFSLGRRILSITLILTLILGMIPNLSMADYESNRSKKDDQLRGIWVASVYNIDYPSSKTLTVDQLKKSANEILDRVSMSGLNAVFLQVRPEGDALYKSSYYPWSRFLTGKQGLAPAEDFDPLAYWVEEAHKRGLELHAWINPLRVTADSSMTLSKLDRNNPARVNYKNGWVLKKNGKYYLDPGYPQVRDLIVKGAEEIAKNYDVDGIHMDDYFYPGSVNDAKSYALYGNGISKNNWRRSNIDTLVKDIGEAVHKVNPNIEYGISPFGIWANKKSNKLGSDTAGNQSYYSMYADTRKWVKEEYVDYIMPQLYWHIGFKIADFEKLLSWWSDVTSGTSVKLYIGHNLNNTTKKNTPWYNGNEIKNQISMCNNNVEYDGSVYFSYKYLQRSKLAYNALREVNGMMISASKKNVNSGSKTAKALETDGSSGTVTPVENNASNTTANSTDSTSVSNDLTMISPAKNISTYDSAYTLTGTSNINEPLYINGVKVGKRSETGEFKVPMILEYGSNIFNVAQGDKKISFNIKRKYLTNQYSYIKLDSIPQDAAQAVSKIPAYSVFPHYSVYKNKGGVVTLSCAAPANSVVKALINGEEINLKPVTVSSTIKKGPYLIKYSNKYNVPANYTTKSSLDLGKIQYSIQYKGTESVVTSKGKLSVLADNARVLAKIKNTAQSFQYVSLRSGPFLSKNGSYESGMCDFVTKTDGVSGSGNELLYLGVGNWVRRADVTLSSRISYRPVISSANYTEGERFDYIDFNMIDRSTAKYSYKPSTGGKGGVLTYTIESAGTAPLIQLPTNSPFSAVTSSLSLGRAIYKFDLKPDKRINGIYTESTSNGIRMVINRHDEVIDPNSLSYPLDTANPDLSIEARKVLKGKVILLDPGHGGADGGASGYGRKAPNEATINLSVALQLKTALEELGAEVDIVRDSNFSVKLHERVNDISTTRPDIFLSIHANSASTSAKGFEILYRDSISKDLAQVICDEYIAQTGLVNRGVKYRPELFVIQPNYTPTVLAELGFMSNKSEHAWMASASGQQQITKALTDGIVKYFSK